MNKVRFIVLTLLLSLALVVWVDGCSRVKTKQANATKESSSDLSNQKTIQETSLASQQQDIAKQSKVDSVADNNLDISSSRRYARENPFVSLISERPKTDTRSDVKRNDENIKKSDNTKAQENKPAVRESTLGLISLVDNSKAIFSDDGFIRVVSVGDIIAGMKVLEIQADTVILRKDNKDIKIIIGEQRKITLSTAK